MVHIDFFDFAGHNFLLWIYSYSKWIELRVVKTTTAEETISHLNDIWGMLGFPELLVSENEPLFTSIQLNSWCVKNINLYHLPPFNPQSNGLA